MMILTINPALMGEIGKYTHTVTTACQLYIIPIAVMLTMCQSVFGGLFGSSDNRIDFTPVFRGIFLVCILFGYTELVTVLSGALDEFSNLIASKAGVTEFLNAYQETSVESTSFFDFSILKWVAGWFQENGTALIRLVILSIRDVMFAFLVISGPIAISLGIIGIFKNLVNKWLQSLITIQFWTLTLALLDHLAKFFLLHYSAVDVTQGGVVLLTKVDLTGYICTNVVITLMYLMVPYLTSLYAGGSQAGMFMSKVVTVATALAMPAARATRGGKSLGAIGKTGAAGVSNSTGVSTASSGAPYARSSSAGFTLSNKKLQD